MTASTKARALAVAALLPLTLAGCFEITTDAAFNDSGGVTAKVEFAVTQELAAMMSDPQFNKETQGGGSLFKDCAKPVEAKDLPEGVRSMQGVTGQRDGMQTCTVTAEIPDPIAALAKSKEKGATKGGDFTLEPITDGYRVRGMVDIGAVMGGAGGDAGKQLQGLGMMAGAMFGGRNLTLSLVGARIENANGQVSADQTRVTWKWPIASIFAGGTGAPLKIEADVIFRESLFSKWKRRIFG